MFERFSDQARRVVVYAQEESRLLNGDHIGTAHLLLGLLHDDTTIAALLGEFGVNLAAARNRLGPPQQRTNSQGHGHIPFTPRVKQTLEQSWTHAQRLGQDHIDAPHLLRALLDVRDGGAARTLAALGVQLDALAARADELGARHDTDTDPGVATGPRAVATILTAAPRQRRPWRPRHRRGSAEADLAAQLCDVLADRTTYAQALRRYGRHEAGCAGDPDSCSCGLQQILDRLDPPTPD